MKFRYLLITTFLFLLSFGTVFSQSIIIPESPQALILKAAPEFPQPESQVSFSVSSVSIDLNRANIVWLVNGQSFKSGIALKSVELMAPANGETMTVAANVTAFDGTRISRSITLRPALVDLLWEAYSYTPPFYKGKGLPSHETLIKVLAVPEIYSSNGNRIDSGDLVYTWSKDGTVLGSLSGTGKDLLMFRMPKLGKTERISVEVTSFDNRHKAIGSYVFTSRDPLNIFYEEHPLYGMMFNKALVGNISLSSNELTITAYPYYFSSNTATDDKLQSSWRVNRSGVNDGDNKITLRAPEGQRGMTEVIYKTDNIKELMQSASASIGLIFGTGGSDENPFF